VTGETTTAETAGRSESHELMLVGGEWVAGAGERFASVENPAHRGSVIAQVPRAGAEDVDRAVTAAARACDSWWRVPSQERGLLLLGIADDFEAQAEDIARTLTSETGNAIRTQTRPEALRITLDKSR
jgi:acyl-CoA reductase-like NAD-dependent aldehyde dehydrogenase